MRASAGGERCTLPGQAWPPWRPWEPWPRALGSFTQGNTQSQGHRRGLRPFKEGASGPGAHPGRTEADLGSQGTKPDTEEAGGRGRGSSGVTGQVLPRTVLCVPQEQVLLAQTGSLCKEGHTSSDRS